MLLRKIKEKRRPRADMGCRAIGWTDLLFQDGPTFFFRQVKNNSLVGPEGQESPLGTIFEN
jgi:hypothetical protein